MFLSFLLFGTFGFWALTVLSVLLIGIAVESERPGWATTCLLTGFGALAFFGDFNVFRAIAQHPAHALSYVIIYLAVGTVWSVYKWYRFLLKSRNNCEDKMRAWLSSQSEFARIYNHTTQEYTPAKYELPPVGSPVIVPNHLKANLAQYLIPSVNQNKSRIVSWMMYWPTSVVWHLLSDWVREIFDTIYRFFKGVFTSLRNRIFADVAKDIGVDMSTRD